VGIGGDEKIVYGENRRFYDHVATWVRGNPSRNRMLIMGWLGIF
jgi:hypothetical protein